MEKGVIMKKGKSTYQFPINVDPNVAHQTIMNWLGANSFELKQKDGQYYYQYSDPIVGKRLFEFYLQPGMVTINAYIGKYKKPYLLDDSFAGSVPKSAYKQILAPLFQTLSSYNVPGQPGDVSSAAPGNGSPYGGAATGWPQPAPNDYGDFAGSAEKTNEKLAIAGFVISIIGLLLSFVGYTYGVLLYVLEFYFASRGIRSKRRGFAIATYVVAGVSILILVGTIFLYALL